MTLATIRTWYSAAFATWLEYGGPDRLGDPDADRMLHFLTDLDELEYSILFYGPRLARCTP